MRQQRLLLIRIGTYSTTDSDGRCSTLLDPSKKPAAGVYKMIFETGAYFATLNQETFYPKVEVRGITIKFRRHVVADPDISHPDRVRLRQTARTLSYSAASQSLQLHHLPRKLVIKLQRSRSRILQTRSSPAEGGESYLYQLASTRLVPISSDLIKLSGCDFSIG